MNTADTDTITFRLEPGPDIRRSVDEVVALLSPTYSVDAERVDNQGIGLTRSTPAYRVKAKIEVDPHEPNAVRRVLISANVEQPDETADALNSAICMLSKELGFTVLDNGAPYSCQGCGLCEYCDRLVRRFGRRRTAHLARKESLARMASFPNREGQFIAAVKKGAG